MSINVIYAQITGGEFDSQSGIKRVESSVTLLREIHREK